MAGARKEWVVATVHRSCKRFAALGRIRFAPRGQARRRGQPWTETREHTGSDEHLQSRRRRRRRSGAALAAVAGMLLAWGPVMPAHALEAGAAGVCPGSMALSFSPGLTAVPAARTFTVPTTTTFTCTGLPVTSSFTVSALTMNSASASCAGMVATGVGTMSFGTSSATVTMLMVGISPLQVWIGIDLSGNFAITASGVFTWTNTGEIESCLLGSTSTMTLWGAFAVAA